MNTFKDPEYHEEQGEFKYKLVSWIYEDKPIKANLSTLLVRHRTGNLSAFSESGTVKQAPLPPTIPVSIGRQDVLMYMM